MLNPVLLLATLAVSSAQAAADQTPADVPLTWTADGLGHTLFEQRIHGEAMGSGIVVGAPDAGTVAVEVVRDGEVRVETFEPTDGSLLPVLQPGAQVIIYEGAAGVAVVPGS